MGVPGQAGIDQDRLAEIAGEQSDRQIDLSSDVQGLSQLQQLRDLGTSSAQIACSEGRNLKSGRSAVLSSCWMKGALVQRLKM